jgi:hypothetical protein
VRDRLSFLDPSEKYLSHPGQLIFPIGQGGYGLDHLPLSGEPLSDHLSRILLVVGSVHSKPLLAVSLSPAIVRLAAHGRASDLSKKYLAD